MNYSMDSMKKMLVTPVFPALIVQPGNLSEQKFVLISPVPAAVQRQYVIFEVHNPALTATKWLGIPYYMVKRRTLAVQFLVPNGKVILQRCMSFSTVCPMGRVLWNTKDGVLNLITPRFNLPPSVFYFCLAENFNNPVKQPDRLLSADKALSSENALSRRGMPEQSANMVKVDKDIPASALHLSTAEPETEPDIVKLLPVDPFGMGLSDSSD